VVWESFQVLYLLLAVKHLPALDTEYLSVGFGLDDIEAVDKCAPLF
jgi:hypothetical protein